MKETKQFSKDLNLICKFIKQKMNKETLGQIKTKSVLSMDTTLMVSGVSYLLENIWQVEHGVPRV